MTYTIEDLKENGLLLEHFDAKDKTEEACIEAVKQNGYALEFVEFKTDKVCEAAIKQNEKAKELMN